MPSGAEVARADDLRSLVEAIGTVPEESLLLHAGHNDFSTWLMARTEFDLAKAIKPVKSDEFTSPSEMRDYLLSAVRDLPEPLESRTGRGLLERDVRAGDHLLAHRLWVARRQGARACVHQLTPERIRDRGPHRGCPHPRAEQRGRRDRRVRAVHGRIRTDLVRSRRGRRREDPRGVPRCRTAGRDHGGVVFVPVER